jgi:hypothetical protein
MFTALSDTIMAERRRSIAIGENGLPRLEHKLASITMSSVYLVFTQRACVTS